MKGKPIEELAVWRGPLTLERFILKILPIVVMLLLVASVTMRYLLKMDLYGIEEIMAIVAMWMYMMGAAYGSYEGSHIRADIIDTFLKNEKIKVSVKLLENAIVLAVLFPFSWWGLQYAAWNIDAGNRTAYWKFPTLLSQLPITIGIILMLIYSLYHTWRTLRHMRAVFRGGRPPEKDGDPTWN